jgi:hypothetical protein
MSRNPFIADDAELDRPVAANVLRYRMRGWSCIGAEMILDRRHAVLADENPGSAHQRRGESGGQAMIVGKWPLVGDVQRNFILSAAILSWSCLALEHALPAT